MSQTVTRRQWALGTVAAVAAAPPPLQAQAAGDSPAELLTQARQGVERTRETLSKYKIPMSLEPATRFEA